MLCDKSVPLRLKDKFYRVAVMPSLLYGYECRPLRNAQERWLKIVKMCILHWICGSTMIDYISNVTFRHFLGVESISKKIRERRLHWYGHVPRKCNSATVTRVERKLLNYVWTWES